MTPDAWHKEAKRILDQEQKIEHFSTQDAISIQSSNEIERLRGGEQNRVLPTFTHIDWCDSNGQYMSDDCSCPCPCDSEKAPRCPRHGGEQNRVEPVVHSLGDFSTRLDNAGGSTPPPPPAHIHTVDCWDC